MVIKYMKFCSNSRYDLGKQHGTSLISFSCGKKNICWIRAENFLVAQEYALVFLTDMWSVNILGKKLKIAISSQNAGIL